MNTAYRTLVTGSRHWTDRDLLESTLEDFLGSQRIPPDQVALVVGDCPTGADAMAVEWATRVGIPESQRKPFQADWATHGRAAGPMRNQDMVDSGADWCFAFPLPGSRGTWDCVRRAGKAEIPVSVVTEKSTG